MKTKGKDFLHIYPLQQTNRCAFLVSTGFHALLILAEILAVHRTKQYFKDFLFCNIFISRKYFQLFIIRFKKGSMWWNIFQALSQLRASVVLKKETEMLFKTDLSLEKIFLVVLPFPSLYSNRRELQLQRLHLWHVQKCLYNLLRIFQHFSLSTRKAWYLTFRVKTAALQLFKLYFNLPDISCQSDNLTFFPSYDFRGLKHCLTHERVLRKVSHKVTLQQLSHFYSNRFS